MSSITAEYVVVNCQDKAKYRRKDHDKITGLAMTTTENFPEIDAETIKAEVLVPHLSREGRKRIKQIFSEEQGIGVKFDYVKREVAEKEYLKPGEVFAVPTGKKLARITLSGLPGVYSSLEPLAEIDRILGFPDFRAEKPLYLLSED